MVAELGGQVGVVVVMEGIISMMMIGGRVVGEVGGLDVAAGDGGGIPKGLGGEVRPGARREVGEHLVEEIVMEVGLLDLVMMEMKILKRDLRGVQEGVHSLLLLLHFSATRLHNHPRRRRRKKEIYIYRIQKSMWKWC